MRWSNVLVIFRREVLDQLRDRRTLFMIFVFPILLYPILGAGVLQFAAALQERPRVVVIVGAEHLPESPPLLNAERNGFNPALFDGPAEAGKLLVELQPDDGPWGKSEVREKAVREGGASAVMVIPADLPEQFRAKNDVAIPIHYKSVDEPSQITYLRLREALDRWKRGIVEERRKEDKLPAGYIQPIEVQAVDAATAQEVGGNVWGRIFPFLLVLMSLTGAFYPAVDLCAGEKERGTMETLLISPATRSEIVWGKFLTVFLASVTTAVLNLVSMAVTGLQLAQRATGFTGADPSQQAAAVLSPPTLQSTFWMAVLLIPLAAFFSAICLALAVLARSMKEGQYYMTPLYLVCLPLIFLTMAPGIELNLFYSLVPVTGAALLLRALIVGDYGAASLYFIPVLAPTLIYAWLALRWAVEQFQSEDVLFRESERFNLRLWLRHLYRDRESRPSGAQALLCFALIILVSWLLAQYMLAAGIAGGLGAVAAGQGLILLPPVVMALLLTKAPRDTLRLRWADPRYFALAVVMVVVLNPMVNELRWVVEWLFPLSAATRESLGGLVQGSAGFWTSVLVFALLPAVCEETAFRGFILSGLEPNRAPRSAVFLSALMFGFLHVLLSLYQQLFNATLLGVFLGLLAVRSRSLAPGIVFHALNNGFAIGMKAWIEKLQAAGLAGWLYREPGEGLYHWVWVGLGMAVAVALFAYLWKLDRSRGGSAERRRFGEATNGSS